MASMALSTVAWAVIMTICGRSPSGACGEVADEVQPRPARHAVVHDEEVEAALGQAPVGLLRVLRR